MSVLVNLNSKVLAKGAALPKPLEKGKLRLYGMRFCPFVQRVMLYLVKKNIPVEIVNIKPRDVPEWYSSKHFKNQIPALEIGGFKETIIESAAISEFLDDLFPETRILPTNAYQKAQQKLLSDRINAFNQTFFAVVAIVQSDEGKAEKYAALVKAFEEIETLLSATFFSGSSTPGFVDYMVFPSLQRVLWLAHIFPDFPLSTKSFPGSSGFPKLSSWYAKMENLPEVIEVGPIDELGVKYFDAYIRGNTDCFDYGLD